jgi:hypothetical protein
MGRATACTGPHGTYSVEAYDDGVLLLWGDRWLREGHAAVLMVRSVLVPETYNLIINPRHADAVRINRLTSFPYPLDSRLP